MRWLAVILFSGSLVSAQEQITVGPAQLILYNSGFNATAQITIVPSSPGLFQPSAHMVQEMVAVGGAYMELSVARRQGYAQTFSLPLPEGSSVPAVLQFVSFETWPVAIQ